MARGKVNGRFSPRRAGGQDESSGDEWLTTYGDAITLLMAFFVMLYAMSSTDSIKFKELVRGLEAPFGNSASSMGLLDAGVGIVGDGGSMPTQQLNDPMAKPDAVAMAMAIPVPDATRLDKADGDAASSADRRGDGAGETRVDPQLGRRTGAEGDPVVTPVEQLEQVRLGLVADLESAGLTGVADYTRDERGLVVSIAADDVLFASGSATVRSQGQRVLAAVAGSLADIPNALLVEGHTDDVPLRRDGYSNWNLSTDRAVAVLELLHDEFGLDSRRLAAVGYGQYQPRVPNSSAANRSVNRRVDLVVVALGELDNG